MSNHALIIAEAGVNHNGSLATAKRLVEAAAYAGADFVKFQTFKAAAVVSRSAKKANYQLATTNPDESQLEMLRRLELSAADHEELVKHCTNCGIRFLSTAFDMESIGLLKRLGVAYMKVPSGEITNLPYLRAIAQCGKPVILSTGMSTEDEVSAALEVLAKCSVTLLHCTTNYPCPFESVNLRAMQTLRTKFGVPVGYSDHTRGIEIAIAAVAMGATVIEKHFTLDHNMEGPDHRASLEPFELREMISAIRNVELAFGSDVKEPTLSELENLSLVRRSIVAKVRIRKGDLLTESNLDVKRPGSGISPMKWDEVVGTTALRDYEVDELI